MELVEYLSEVAIEKQVRRNVEIDDVENVRTNAASSTAHLEQPTSRTISIPLV
jgi:hypothetical protein